MFLVLVLLRNPVVFALTLFRYVHFLVSDSAFGAYVAPRHPAIDEALRAGLGSGGALERRIRVVAAYEQAHFFARYELYRASREFALNGSRGRHLWRKLFGPVTPGEVELRFLAAVVNNTTGYLSVLARLGMGPSRRATERMLVFPRYFRCLLGLVFDAMCGGVRGNESRVIVAAAAAIAAAVVLAT